MPFIGSLIGIVTGGWLKWILIGGAVAGFLWLADDYRYKTEQIAILQDREAGWKKAVKAAELNADQANDTVAALDTAKETFKVDVDRTCTIWNEVKDSADPVGGLLEKLKEPTSAQP